MREYKTLAKQPKKEELPKEKTLCNDDVPFKDVIVNTGKSLYKNGVKISTWKESVRVIINEYMFVHGKKPRGYGSWSFLMACNKMDVLYLTGKYSDCLKTAKKMAKASGYLSIAVGA
jgi:hypothetical protein